jgi:hypothetical protein
MSDLHPPLKNRAFKISDCQIWAEIYYLDSPTNYRECLHPMPLAPSILRNDLMMLDERSRRSCAGVNLWLLLIGLLSFMGAAFLLCLLMDSF